MREMTSRTEGTRPVVSGLRFFALAPCEPCLSALLFCVLLCRLVLQHGGTGQNAPADENAHDADGDNKSSAHVFTSGPALTRGWLTSGKGASPFLLRQARLYSCCWK